MARRFAATSALVLAALALSPAARAQGFFSFYELSPRDVLSRIDDQGYSPRIPMTRRGDVYIVDAQSHSGQSVRLIVSSHDGRVLERYAVAPRWREERNARWRDEAPRANRDGDENFPPERGPQAALGDPSRPRVLNFDGLNQDRLIPPASVPDASAPGRSQRNIVKKPVAAPPAKEPLAPPVEAVAPAEPRAATPKIVELPPAKAVAAPVKTEPPVTASPPKPANPRIIEIPPAPPRPDVKIKPLPEPNAQAKVEPPKPAAPRIVGEPISPPSPPAKAEDKPKLKPEVAPAQARVDDKPPAPRKKLNDLPVGTLD